MRYSCAYNVVIFLELAAFLRHASLESASFRERCPRPYVKNGWVKLRSRGRIAKFNCIREFQLLGEKFATCLGGEWDNPAPLCVKPGCELLTLSNGQMMETYRGAVVTFFCNPGYRLQGIAKLYCDGKTWNGTAPQCTATSSHPAVSCDFESEDLCGWSQDPHHHFNWTRLNHNTPSGSVGTGPSYDHTFGKGNDGYYLYIETSGPRKQNDTARLYSPVYGTEVLASQPSCFIFWYHMYGATVGSLAVYIKPENMELTSDLEAGFFQSGNKGDVWLKGVINIPSIGVPFQIIIEGVRGPGYVGDTAIDDVRLANGSDCEQPTTDLRLMTTYVTHELSTEGAVTTGNSRISRTFPTPPHLPPLEPHPLESTQTMTTSEDVFRPIPIPPDPTPLILNLPTRPAPSTTTVQIPTTPATTTSTTVAATTSTTVAATTTSTTVAATTTTTSTTAKNPSVTTTSTTAKKLTAATTTTTSTTAKKPTVTTRTTVKKPTVAVTTTVPTTKRLPIAPTIATTKTAVKNVTVAATTAPTKTTTKKPIVARTTLKSPIVAATTKTTIKKAMVTTPKPRPSFRSTKIPTKPTTPTASITRSPVWRPNTMRSFLDDDIQGKEWKTVPREPLMQSDQSVSISLIAGITVLVATVAVVSIAVSIFIRQRRKSRSQQNLAEDSDVRFLTTDEILDFTLARPREEDYDSN